ncbi:MAG: hypothetical protein M3R67_07890 [Acidobacteriota bacterium]|nr:hypothetical protein [Acidobacteriota bacterium]
MVFRASILSLTIISIWVFGFPAPARALQAREHLTPQEVELVKDAQELDKRIDVFVKAADRRVLAINRAQATEATNAKQLKKDSESWGDLPSGTRAELIGDIARIFEEAITNIDDVSARDEKNPLLPKALRKLAAAASRIVDHLKPLQAEAQSDEEIGRFDQLIDNAESILQAANKLPPPVEKKGKSKTAKTTEVH